MPEVGERTKRIREAQQDPTEEITAIMVSRMPEESPAPLDSGASPSLAALEEFVAAVVFGYLEMHEYNEAVMQCPWCLWIPGSDWRGPHDCEARTFAADPAINAAWERTKEGIDDR